MGEEPVSKLGDLNISGSGITYLFTFKQQKATIEEPGPAWVLGKTSLGGPALLTF